MSSTDVNAVVKDLDRWSLGELGSKLTWEVLESRFGFSRQSLQAKPEIKAAYLHAKNSLSGGLVKSREQATQENEELIREIEKQKIQIEEYQKRENLWKQRWQRIAYHIRQKGIQMYNVDKSIEGEYKPLNDREVAEIIRPFDKEIPPSGRV